MVNANQVHAFATHALLDYQVVILHGLGMLVEISTASMTAFGSFCKPSFRSRKGNEVAEQVCLHKHNHRVQIDENDDYLATSTITVVVGQGRSSKDNTAQCVRNILAAVFNSIGAPLWYGKVLAVAQVDHN